jgi:hypothetical protein
LIWRSQLIQEEKESDIVLISFRMEVLVKERVALSYFRMPHRSVGRILDQKESKEFDLTLRKSADIQMY